MSPDPDCLAYSIESLLAANSSSPRWPQLVQGATTKATFGLRLEQPCLLHFCVKHSSCAPESVKGVVPTQGEGSDYPPWGGTSRVSFVFRAWGAHLGHLPLNVLGYSRNERRIANSESCARGEGWCSLCGTPAKPMKLKSVEMGAS